MQESTLTTHTAELHWVTAGPVSEAGEGARPTLVFLHYFGGSTRTWEPVMAGLENDFACVALDLRGFGASKVTRAPEANESYSVAAMAGDVAAVIEHLGLRNYFLVAHSMSGKVALYLASGGTSAPVGLAGLILVGPSPLTPEPMKDQDRARMLAGWGSREAAEQTLAKITARPLPESLAAVAVADMLRTSADAWRAWLELGSRESLPERMQGIQVPVALIAGEKDPVITPELVRSEVAGHLPEKFAPLMVVRGVGHLMPLEAPEVLSGAIRQAAGVGV